MGVSSSGAVRRGSNAVPTHCTVKTIKGTIPDTPAGPAARRGRPASVPRTLRPSFPRSAWERKGEKLRFSDRTAGPGPMPLSREAELRDVRSQAELGHEG